MLNNKPFTPNKSYPNLYASFCAPYDNIFYTNIYFIVLSILCILFLQIPKVKKHSFTHKILIYW